MSTYSERFQDGYVTCALWSSSDQSDDQGGRPLDECEYELAPVTEDALRTDCDAFIAANENTLLALWVSYRNGMTPEQAGHDFWLTRNGHGAGFWDRGLGAIGDELTEAAHAFGECDLYIGDDDQIYAFGREEAAVS